MPKKEFVRVGERIRYIGTSKYRDETWPKDAWLEKGITGTVTEFHEESPEVIAGGERFEAIPAYAVVTWDFGGRTAIDAEYEGRTWERIELPTRGGNPNGTCYEDAWRYLIKEEEGYLIHGSLQLSAEGRRVKHAWVELPTGFIWEPQTKSYYTVKDFQIMSPLEEQRYTDEEAAIMAARTGKHGPWTKEEREQFLKRGNPEEVPAVPEIKHRGTEPEGIAIADELGVRYDGILEGIAELPSQMMFTDVRQTGSTFTANTLEEARTKLADMRAKFARPLAAEVPTPEVERAARIKYFRGEEAKWRETAYKIAEKERGEAPFAEAIRKADEFGRQAAELEAKPLAVEEVKEGNNPMGKVINKEEAIGLLERLSMTPGEAARSLVAEEAERREIMQTVQQRVKREQNKWAPMDPRKGPPLPRIFAGLRWPWKK